MRQPCVKRPCARRMGNCQTSHSGFFATRAGVAWKRAKPTCKPSLFPWRSVTSLRRLPSQIAQLDPSQLAIWISGAPDPQRTALALFYLDEFDYREILELAGTQAERAFAVAGAGAPPISSLAGCHAPRKDQSMKTPRLSRRMRALLNCAPISKERIRDRSMRSAVFRANDSNEFANQQSFDRGDGRIRSDYPHPAGDCRMVFY